MREQILATDVPASVLRQLTPKQLLRLQEGSAYMQTKLPGFLSILFDNTSIDFITDMPTAFVAERPIGGHQYGFNPLYFAAKSAMNFSYAVTHEILHVTANHLRKQRLYFSQHFPGVPVIRSAIRAGSRAERDVFEDNGRYYLPAEQPTWAKAIDYWVNAMADESEVGERHSEWLDPADVGVDLKIHSTEDIYVLTYNLGSSGPDPSSLFKPGGTGQPGQPLDEHRTDEDIPLDPATDTPEHIDQEVGQRLRQLVQTQKLAGEAPTALQRWLDAYNASQVTWQDHLSAQVMSSSAGYDEYDYGRIAMPYYLGSGVIVPRSIQLRTGPLICAIDTSGSMSVEEIKACLSEVGGIATQSRPEALVLLPVDSRVYDPIWLEPEEFTDFDNAMQHVLARCNGPEGLRGRGGTSFNPPFKWIAEHMPTPPAHMIYLTDGYGDCNFPAPSYPVTWVTTGVDSFPFGSVIKIKI